MSHDIRTPMNAIIGFTTLAASHVDDEAKVKEYLKKIATSSEHLLSLINDVLDMSRIESGKVKIEQKPLHLPDLLHDMRTIIQPNIVSKQLDFLIDTVDVRDEAVAALTMLGFSPAPTAKVVTAILTDDATLPVEQVVKLALKQIK